MATLSCSESRSMYSWWWNSHNTPKNSKWLQENLIDIDAKVESMIKLIEEDGDSFARKAEMYYKKRPELMKHVEEFYRAYRALAERYNHAIGELRHAHYALARAFPQITKEPPSKPLVLGQDLHSQQVEPLKLNVCEPSTAVNTLFEKDSVAIINNDPQIGCAEGGMTTMALNNNLEEDKGAGHISISVEGRNFDDHVILLSSENSYKNTTLVKSELEGKIENEVESLKDAPAKMGAEIKNILPDQLCSSKLSFMKSEVEVCGGRDSVSDLNRKWLEQDLSSAEEEVKQLTNDVLIGNLKLRNAEGKYNLLMISKQSLKNEADYLAKKIAAKDQQLSEKHEELETLQKYLQAESLQRTQIECTIKTLTTLHAQSQEDQKALAIELKHVLQMLTQLETNKQGLDEAVQLARGENEVLCQTNLHAAACIEDLQKELISLSEVKSRLEKKVSCHMSKTESLQHEVSCLKEEIKVLNKKHKALVEQVETTRLSLNCVASEVKSFRDKNPVLGQNNVQSNGEREILLENIGSVEEQYESNIVAGTTFSNFNTELERSQMNTKSLQERCQHGQVGNTEVVSGKATLLSQLQVVTRSMHSLLEKNAISENSLSAARHELEVLREKSKGLETICGILKEERSYLLNERDSLSLKLKTVERKLESLQKRCMVLQEKYYCLEKEKEAMHNQVQELEGFLSVERKERGRVQMDSDLRMADLEKQIQQLEEENRWQQEEYQGELEDSLKAQIEFFVLKKFVKYIEGTNDSLISECQKHVETSVLAEKLISALESESFEQQLETELLLDKIERLRLYIHEIFKALDDGPEGQIDTGETMITHILGIIEGMKHSLLKHDDEKQLCLVENSVISALLDQLSSDLLAAELQKKHMEKELLSLTNEIFNVKLEKDEVLELNKKLQSELSECQWHAVILEAEKDCLCIKHDDLLEAYKGMVERNSQLVQDNRNLLMRFSDLESEKRLYDHYLDEAILEHLISINQSSIFRSLVTEKTAEMKLTNQEMEKDHEISCGLKRDIGMLSQKLGLYKAESLLFRDTIRKLEGEIRGMRECNVEMKKDAQSVKDMLLHMEQKLSSTELRLDAAEKLNLQLCQTIDELKSDEQESLHLRANLEKNVCNLSEKNSILMAEVDVLHKAKGELETELSLLGKQLNEKTSREENALAEENAFLQMKQLKVYHNHEPEFSEAASDAGTCLPRMFEEEPLLSNQGIELPLSKFEQLKHRRFLRRRKRQRQSRKNGNNLDSPKIQRIKTKPPVFREGMRMKDTALAQVPESKSIHFRLHDQMLDLSETAENARNDEQLQLIVRRSYATSQKDTYYSRSENSEVNHLSTDSDIEKELSANKLLLTRITEPSREMKSIDVLERLISDAKTMQTLLAAVDHLKIKLRTCENGKNSRNVDLERVQQNLQETEEAILQLIDLNIYLVKNIDGCPYPSPLLVNDALHTRHVTELAREGSEEIHRMQLEIQKIQHILLKVEEQENKRTRNRTIIRRDFFYRGRNNKGKQKNSVCGCFKPSTSGSEWLAEADATTSHCIVN